MHTKTHIIFLCLSVMLLLSFAVKAETSNKHLLFPGEHNPFVFDDHPMSRDLKYPEWFKSSFLNFPEDLQDVRRDKKLGLIVYFGQDNCAYCVQLLDINFKKRTDIISYTQRFFDVVAVDIWGNLPVVMPDGRHSNEKQFANIARTQFTPSLIFYNPWGKEIFRMRGYYPPYRFRAALDYVVGGYYQKENFREYLERADPPLVFDEDELNPSSIFTAPPYLLERRTPATRPLVVFFEQSKCHACDVLHSGPLNDKDLLKSFANMEVVQLGIWADTPVITPAGKKTTARKWADDLELFYTPTILFFDEQGEEIIRIDSTVRLYRLSKVVLYVLTKAYQAYPNFQRWHTRLRQQQGE
ncbi:thioredoxin fold domain-containing protein [Candidatus Venteria ishoeyi]|uniref:thioredoxin family protein n=1 Tax=Candidatus Venteria ishoeyi TaxID=1899563 RepID=UPI0025A5D970|nr:thioredoxin fold domain-containing protein [Candidatus Venteria ishoeyi]MDM8546385.1 thioredoxin fold domain-containing protein [Candidatus Venteria ishoeyi]